MTCHLTLQEIHALEFPVSVRLRTNNPIELQAVALLPKQNGIRHFLERKSHPAKVALLGWKLSKCFAKFSPSFSWQLPQEPDSGKTVHTCLQPINFPLQRFKTFFAENSCPAIFFQASKGISPSAPLANGLALVF